MSNPDPLAKLKRFAKLAGEVDPLWLHDHHDRRPEAERAELVTTTDRSGR